MCCGWGDYRPIFCASTLITTPISTHAYTYRIVGDAPLYIYCSPYTRTKQTLARIVECLDGNTIVGVREEPRLTEQVC